MSTLKRPLPFASLKTFLFRLGSPALLSCLLMGTSAPATAESTVRLSTLSDRVRIEIGGQLFTEYIFGTDAAKPYLHPILAADGTQLTRNFPMADVAGEEQDHPHHRSLWFAHGSVNGVDFWAEKDGVTGRIVHDGLIEVKTNEKNEGVIRARRRWVAADGQQVCSDEISLRVTAVPAGRLLDFEIRLIAPKDRPVVFGDTKEGTMAIRLAKWMTLPHRFQGRDQPGVGQMVNSVGQSGAGVWGKRAAWVDYFAPREGKVYGVALFDHPSNPRHPTWWHARDYGLFAANPFGRHDFENLKDQPRAGEHVLAPGESVSFRYRFYVHQGDTAAARVAEHFLEFAAR